MTLEERINLIRSNTERRIRVHESRKGLRAQSLRTGALRRKNSDEARDKEDVFVAQEPVSQALVEKESFNPKRKSKKRRLSFLNFWIR